VDSDTKPKAGDIVRYRWKGLFGNEFEATVMVCAVDGL